MRSLLNTTSYKQFSKFKKCLYELQTLLVAREYKQICQTALGRSELLHPNCKAFMALHPKRVVATLPSPSWLKLATTTFGVKMIQALKIVIASLHAGGRASCEGCRGRSSESWHQPTRTTSTTRAAFSVAF